MHISWLSRSRKKVLAVPGRLCVPVQNLYLSTCASQGELTAYLDTNTVLCPCIQTPIFRICFLVLGTGYK